MGEPKNTALKNDATVLTELLKSVSHSPHQVATTLLAKYPSFSHLPRAEEAELQNIVGNDATHLLLTIPKAVTALTREFVSKSNSYIHTLDAAKPHFAAILNGLRNEVFAVLYINAQNRLIDEDIWEGSLDRVSIYQREILRRALLLDSTAILISHNHPSGNTNPSEQDIRMTENLQSQLELFDIVLFDHLVFGEGSPFSFRKNLYL